MRRTDGSDGSGTVVDILHAKTIAMYASSIRATMFVALTLAAATGSAARGVLTADGILRVKGAEISTTSITVVPEGAPSYSLPIGTKHFTLLLPLDNVYLISVQREGCPTKEIYLDTRVPAEMHAADFQFPFMVTLEHMTPERMFAYAGPVGFVRYLHQLKDFGYETEYAIQVDEDLRLRMDAVRETGVDPKVMLAVQLARVVDRPRGMYSAGPEPPVDQSMGTLAPMVFEVPLMVHVVITDPAVLVPALPEILKPVSVEPMIVAKEPPSLPAAAVAMQVAEPKRDRLPQQGLGGAVPIARTIAPPAPVNEARIPAATTAAWVGASLRTEEMIVEPRRLTRIVRFSTPSEHVNEFRKVTHAFGAVYFFHGTDAITERAFEEATTEEVVGGH